MIRSTEAQRMIAKLRAKGFSRYRIAKESGVDWKTIVNWENLTAYPSVEGFRGLSKFYAKPDMAYSQKNK